MNCTYCGEHLESGKGLLVTWQDGVPRPLFLCTTALFCNERCLYKYLALVIREPRVAVQSSSGRILRILTSTGSFLVRGDTWEFTGKNLVIRDAEAGMVAEFPQELIQGVIVKEKFWGDGEANPWKTMIGAAQTLEIGQIVHIDGIVDTPATVLNGRRYIVTVVDGEEEGNRIEQDQTQA